MAKHKGDYSSYLSLDRPLSMGMKAGKPKKHYSSKYLKKGKSNPGISKSGY